MTVPNGSFQLLDRLHWYTSGGSARAAQRRYIPPGHHPAISLPYMCAGYVSFLFFRSKAWWVPLAKQLLRCALWAVGVTQRLPLTRVRSCQHWGLTWRAASPQQCQSAKP